MSGLSSSPGGGVLRWDPARSLAALLSLAGGGTLLALAVVWGISGPPASDWRSLTALGVGALAAAAARRLGAGWMALATLALAAPAFWLWYTTQRPFPAPLLYRVGALSVDPANVLYLPGLLLLCATFRLALQPRARGHRVARLLGLAGCAMVCAYWLWPQHFFIEEVDLSRDGAMPVVVEGQLEQHPWNRNLMDGRPIERLPQLIYNEWVRADMAWGLNLTLSAAGPAPGGAAWYAVLWKIQKALSAGMLYLDGATLFACPLLGVLFLRGRAPGAVIGAAGVLLGALFLLAPLANLGLMATLVAAGLGELGLLNVLESTLLLLGTAAAVDLAGRTLARPGGGS